MTKIIWATKSRSREHNVPANKVRIFMNAPTKDKAGRTRQATSLVFPPLLAATVLGDATHLRVGYAEDTLFIAPTKESKNAFIITRCSSGKATVKVADATFPVLKDFAGDCPVLPYTEKGVYCIVKEQKGEDDHD